MLEVLRVSPASPTPGAPCDRPSASQVAPQQPDHRHVPARDRPAHGADAVASSPRVPDARRGARPNLRRRRDLQNNKIDGTFPSDLCGLGWGCNVKSGNDLVAPCGSTGCCDLGNGAACPTSAPAPAPTSGSSNSGGTASLAIIIPVVVAAVLLLAAILFLVRKRLVAARQPHRESSMPNVGDEAEAEAEA